MALIKNFSLGAWIKQFGRSCRRFPVSVVLLVFLTCFVLFLIHGGEVTDKWQFFYIFYPATGAVLGVSLQLLTEDFKRRSVAVLTQVLVHAAWLGISIYLGQFDRFSLPQFAAVTATVVTMALSVFLLSFYRKGDDVPFWYFSLQTMVAIIAGLVVGGVLTLGLILFAQSLEWLFGVQVSDRVFGSIPTVCMLLLAPLLFMNLIPAGEEKRVREVQSYSGFLKGVVQYLFIPLLLLYMATLYVYAAKILFSWQLPVGWVSYLVTASMVGLVILLYLTYPLQHEQNNSFFKTVTRWLPLAMLPLLALMTVAIGRRLSDYGITVSRLYLLVFNIWCYVVCIGLLITRNKRIWWIPASFAAVLFLISVGPQSIPNVTERRLLGEVRKAFTASGIQQLPLSGKQYDDWLKSADKTVAKSIDDKLHYLQTDFGYVSILGVVGKDAIVGTMDSDEVPGGIVEKVKGKDLHYRNGKENLLMRVNVPEGYSHMEGVEPPNVHLVEHQGNRLVFEVFSGPDREKYRFEVSLNQFAERDLDRNHHESAEPLILDNGSEVFVVDYFDMSVHDNTVEWSNMSGILFTK